MAAETANIKQRLQSNVARFDCGERIGVQTRKLEPLCLRHGPNEILFQTSYIVHVLTTQMQGEAKGQSESLDGH